MKNLYFITPWFGSHSGGAEIYAETLASFLSEKDLPVTILTTTARSPFDPWDHNYFLPGTEKQGKLNIIRFSLNSRSSAQYIEYYNIISSGISISSEQEEIYLSNTIRSSEMEDFIQKHRNGSLFFPIPYPYGVSYFGGIASLPNTIPIPCLHDEPTALFKTMRNLFEKSMGILFLTEPEKRFATTVYSLKGKPSAVLGGGVCENVEGAPKRFREKTGIKKPFILYVGRKVPGKGIDILLNYWVRLKKECPIDHNLVIIGGGDMPGGINCEESGIEDLGSADEEMKFDALSACDILCHLSTKESLSLVLLEAWWMGKPVIVNEQCSVTTHQVLTSGGGVPVHDYFEFKHSLLYLFSNRTILEKMGKNGNNFVRRNFTWEKTVENFKDFISSLPEN